MSKELRALAIVFGVLAGLLVLGLIGSAIALTAFVKHVASEPTDRASLARTVRKIATFAVPHGYQIASANDMGFTLAATLRPENRYSSFRITLQGSPFAASAESQASGAAFGLQIAERMLGCAPAAPTSVEVVVRGARVPMQTLRCTSKRGVPTEAAFVNFRGNVASVTLSALGSGDDFDLAAVRALLASVR